MGEDFEQETGIGGTAVREFYDWIESGITAVVCVILIFTFFGRLVGVDGESMLPTLEHGNRLVATHFLYEPANGDIVVVTKPNPRNEPLIKRVVAVGGQTLDLDFESNSVYVNGEKIDEPYIYEPMEPDSWTDFTFPLTIPEGHVFVMGDNRNNSWDSRWEDVGIIDERHILGKVLYRVLPYDNIGNPDKRW